MIYEDGLRINWPIEDLEISISICPRARKVRQTGLNWHIDEVVMTGLADSFIKNKGVYLKSVSNLFFCLVTGGVIFCFRPLISCFFLKNTL